MPTEGSFGAADIDMGRSAGPAREHSCYLSTRGSQGNDECRHPTTAGMAPREMPRIMLMLSWRNADDVLSQPFPQPHSAVTFGRRVRVGSVRLDRRQRWELPRLGRTLPIVLTDRNRNRGTKDVVGIVLPFRSNQSTAI